MLTAAALVCIAIGARLAYLLSAQDRFNGDEAGATPADSGPSSPC